MSFRIESTSLTFTDTDSATYTFSKIYTIAPIVTLTVIGDDNVNAFVHSVTTTQAVIKLSESGNFTVHVQIIDEINN